MIVILHGLGQSSKDWQFIEQMWVEPVYCPNLKELLGNIAGTYQNLHSRLEDCLSSIEEPISLCGHSLGAVLALNYAIEHPDKLKSLVLMAGQYKMPKLLLKIQKMLFALMPGSSFRDTDFSKSELLSLTKSMMDLNLQNDLAKITAPTLIVIGSRDRANKKASMALTDMITGAKLSLIEGAGHELNRDNPDELAHTLQDFIKYIS